MAKKVTLDTMYQENATAMGQTMRHARIEIARNSRLDLEPEMLIDVITDIMAMLALARFHAEGMLAARELQKAGYVSITKGNGFAILESEVEG